MPLRRRNPDSSPADSWSSTGLVNAQPNGWQVTWYGEGEHEPPDFDAVSLTQAVDLATAAALALYNLGPRPAGATLGFAIYPRQPGGKALMYDITGRDGQFRARNADREVEAASLDALVEAVRQEPGSDDAMLRWIRSFAEL